MTSPSGTVTAADFEQRFKARIVQRLTLHGSSWTAEQAQETADDEWEAYCEYDTERGPLAVDCTPEVAADECLSYYDNDGDE